MSLEHLVEKLAAFEPESELPVVSLYLNAQADEHGRPNFLRVVRKQFSERAKTYEPNSPERESLDADLVRINRYLEADIEQVVTKGYSPPTREKVVEFQKQQQFSICPNPKDPDACNLNKDLKFPPEVYESITEYHEEKAEAQGTN